ncbi:DUF1287 domain-containing protein [Caulobacter mirabilis]|uniref:DUF1287 domain-containing protein n=1 Tax=Caulobacter mirabilis TaxID=69666 RepID=A0A2D2B377_9CAUL|nr:DUF1287 domain-containing protein [Caulobacter mirabilis]ATQ44691.1 DUF1287 domain-containing protein [Caulobacter mirabilis]
MIARRALLAAAPALALPAWAETPWPARLVAAARAQVGRTVLYDPTYVRLAYPGGDVPIERGVCTDVIIRAYRTAFGLDLQRLVHEDMARSFAAYPRTWGLTRPDRNIDHRRVPNLETFLRRKGAAVPLEGAWKAGDLVTQRLAGNLPHIVIVAQDGPASASPRVIHNIGGGARLEPLPSARNIARFRFAPQPA